MTILTTRRAAHWVGSAAALVAGGYFVAYLLRHLEAAPPIAWNGVTVAALLTAVGVIAVAYGLIAVGWMVLLRATGVAAGLRACLGICLVSQAAKYIPGNVAHHVGRAAMASVHGWPGAQVVATIVVEHAWLVLASVLLAMAGLVLGAGTLLEAVPEVPSTGVLALIGAGAVIGPMMLLSLMNRWRPGPLRRLLGSEAARLPRWPAATAVLILYFGFFIANALVLDMMGRVLFGGEGDLLLLSAVFGIGWLAGVITPGAPAGLGIRDLILAAGLTPMFGPGAAAAIAAFHRLCAAVSDLVQLAVGLGLERTAPPRTGPLAR